MYSYLDRHKSCPGVNDGAGEALAESVARILVDSWTTLPTGARLMADHAAKRLVLSSIDGTLDTKDLKAMQTNASTQFPVELKSLCTEIEQQASTSLKHQAAIDNK